MSKFQGKKLFIFTVIVWLFLLNVHIVWGSEVSIPDTSIEINSNFTIPILTSDLAGLGVFGYDCTILYDSALTEYINFKTNGTLSAGYLFAINYNLPGQLIISAAGDSIKGGGVLFYLEFRTKNETGQAFINFQSFAFTENVIPSEQIPVQNNGIVDIALVVSVDTDYDLAVDSHFTITAYPNPFNNTVTISYSVPSPVFVEIEIFNINGRKIKTIVSEMQGKRNYSFGWNGYTDAYIRAGSGIYFCRISMNKSSKIVKLTYIK